MVTILFILVAVFMAATLFTLFAGMFGLVRGQSDGRRSNKLMQYRVLLQGITLVLFAALLYALRG